MNNAQETILKESKSNGEMAQGSDSPLERLVIRQPQSIALNEDCMNVMNRYSDKFFALAIVDPPYGIGVTKMRLGNGIQNFKRGNWDDATPVESYWKELFRVSENQIVFGGNYFDLPQTGGWIVWDKNNGDSDFADGELAWTSFDKPLRIKKIHWCGSAPKWEDTAGKIHPTQKPVALYDWILKIYAEKEQGILDTHLGSGSSRIACHKAGLDFVGCEIDSDYFQAQEKRFNEYLLQLPMQFAAV